MSTNGFITFTAGGRARNAYCHNDSGPGDLGILVLGWLRDAAARPGPLRAAILGLMVLSEDDSSPPTAGQIASLRKYHDRGTGPEDEWYSLLRGTQGHPAEILACGYLLHEDETYGWVYEVDADQQTFSVSTDGRRRATWPWASLPSDREFLGRAAR